MADNTCYRVTVADDGALCGEAIAFRACYADNQANALMRLHSPHLQPPVVPAADWPALLAAYKAALVHEDDEDAVIAELERAELERE